MNPIAVMFVASGHGLIAVISPSNKAVTHGKELLSRRFVRKFIVSVARDQVPGVKQTYYFNSGSIFDFITSVNFCGWETA
jgi:hypothetical protein